MPEIVYEDKHLIVAVKPPNLLTQGDATGDDCLLDQLKLYIKERYHKPGDVYLGLVHRLDRPVGGLVAFARTSKAASRLSEQLRTHAMAREYLAVAEGGASMPDAGELHDWLVQDEETGRVRASFAPGAPGAKEARTRPVSSSCTSQSCSSPASGMEAPPSATARYSRAMACVRSCSLRREAALLVRANATSPPTGRSSRCTSPRYTSPGL